MLPRAVNEQADREQDPESDPVPTYHEQPGEDDAGYYDRSGKFVEFIPPPYLPEPPAKAVVHSETRVSREAPDLIHEVELSCLGRHNASTTV